MPQGRKYVGPVDEKTIGRRLREARVGRGLTQVELAEELGIDQSLISEYERGVVRLHGALLAGIARVLKTSVDEMLGLQKGKGAEQGDIVKDRRIARRLALIDTLPKRKRQALLTTLDEFLKGAGAIG